MPLGVCLCVCVPAYLSHLLLDFPRFAGAHKHRFGLADEDAGPALAPTANAPPPDYRTQELAAVFEVQQKALTWEIIAFFPLIPLESQAYCAFGQPGSSSTMDSGQFSKLCKGSGLTNTFSLGEVDVLFSKVRRAVGCFRHRLQS